jgi:hypothetical protein
MRTESNKSFIAASLARRLQSGSTWRIDTGALGRVSTIWWTTAL